eukprot:TRINITY_DN16196_c0_g1_i1.p1 TRINITY_DN16196_c0_g1~~TRINITY_DN16196_c0_g1_i1.p1  ORF type:complete len:584 (-),score=109.30 TRINITY_DN16196_c0_g1_i1:11-1762(-)
MQLLRALFVPVLVSAVKVTQHRNNPCPTGMTNKFPTTMSGSYNITKDRGTSYLDPVWEVAELQSIANDPMWAVGEHWHLNMKVSSNSDKDRSFAFTGGFLQINVPAGATELLISVDDTVRTDSSISFQYWSRETWTSGAIYMTDICLTPSSCDLYLCPNSMKLKGAGLSGYSEAQCCETKLCKDEGVICEPSTKWAKHHDYDNASNPKAGYDQVTCCVPKICPAQLCVNDTTWADKVEASNLRGSTPEECCERLVCSHHQCSNSKWRKRSNFVSRNPDVLRYGSTDDECCDKTVFCSEFTCSPSSEWGQIDNASTTVGNDTATCCRALSCLASVTCENNSKWGGFKGDPSATFGNTVDECCQKKMCSDYNCSSKALQLLINAESRQGSNDTECCETKTCVDYACPDPTKWIKRARVDPLTGIDRVGYSTEECCEKIMCREDICDPSTQWKRIDNFNTTQGSKKHQCCEKIFCKDYVCDTDTDGDGQGTKWYKKQDTNTYQWQGQTNEECCNKVMCSQFTTMHPTRWTRKADFTLQGSTEAECYDPRFCKDYCCTDQTKVLIPDVNGGALRQGSTDAECCMDPN